MFLPFLIFLLMAVFWRDLTEKPRAGHLVPALRSPCLQPGLLASAFLLAPSFPSPTATEPAFGDNLRKCLQAQVSLRRFYPSSKPSLLWFLQSNDAHHLELRQRSRHHLDPAP